VVAVILGALILGEHLRPSEYLGMILVICAVSLVISSQTSSGRSAAELETSPLEHEA
jgi:drug/metabolite transporter (DMT)-like permease